MQKNKIFYQRKSENNGYRNGYKVKNKNNCRHRRKESLKEYRKNFPFGKKSKPVYSFKRIFGERCLDCGAFIRKY